MADITVSTDIMPMEALLGIRILLDDVDYLFVVEFGLILVTISIEWR